MSQKGSEILLRARQQFRETRTVETLRKIEVPDWGATIYYWPSRSLEERVEIESCVPIGERTAGDLMRFHAAQVRVRSRDEHGNRLFTDEQAAALADTSPEIVELISATMGMRSPPTVEDAEKN